MIIWSKDGKKKFFYCWLIKTVLDIFIDKLKSEFGLEDELIKNRGKVYEYLGITIYYSIADKVVFTMFDYLENMLVEYAEYIKIVVFTIQ